MSDSFNIKQGDTDPPILAVLTDGNGDPVDLSDIGELRFHMAQRGADTPIIDAEAEVVDGPTGSVRYDWVDGDTDTPGVYRCEFELRTGGETRTFPSDGYLTVIIRRHVAREAAS